MEPIAEGDVVVLKSSSVPMAVMYQIDKGEQYRCMWYYDGTFREGTFYEHTLRKLKSLEEAKRFSGA